MSLNIIYGGQQSAMKVYEIADVSRHKISDQSVMPMGLSTIIVKNKLSIIIANNLSIMFTVTNK